MAEKYEIMVNYNAGTWNSYQGLSGTFFGAPTIEVRPCS